VIRPAVELTYGGSRTLPGQHRRADMARILFISPATVAKHMEHIWSPAAERRLTSEASGPPRSQADHEHRQEYFSGGASG